MAFLSHPSGNGMLAAPTSHTHWKEAHSRAPNGAVVGSTTWPMASRAVTVWATALTARTRMWTVWLVALSPLVVVHAFTNFDAIATAATAHDLGVPEVKVAEAYTMLGQRLGLEPARSYVFGL